MRIRRVRRGWAPAPALLALAGAGACSWTPTVFPSRDLDRPTDMTFVCMGVFGATDAPVASGRPMNACHPIGTFDPAADAQHKTFAFIPNSSSGTLTVVDADRWKLIDLDPGAGGYNQAPLGVLPEQIAASDDGCRLVTANRGSCDFTLVDPAALMSPALGTLAPGLPAPLGTEVAQTIVARTTSGPLNLAPQEVRFLPQDISSLTGDGMLCQPHAGSWRALVTFPSCDLIALLELPSGQVLDSVKVVRQGQTVALVGQGASPVCAVRDCGGGASPDIDGGGGGPDAGPPPDASDSDADVDAAADGGAGTDGAGGSVPDGGAAQPPIDPFGPGALRPGSIAVVPDGTGRAYVGLANAAFVVALQVLPGDTIAAGPSGAAIPLAEGARGTNRIRLSVNPYLSTQDPAHLGGFVGDPKSANYAERQYLYAIARDGTLRVVQVAGDANRECDTNIDPLNVPAGFGPDSACIPVSPANRRPFAVGPGIHFGTVPVDVAAADVRLRPPDAPPGPPTPPMGAVNEQTVSGAFAWVLTATGTVFFVNIDPEPRAYLSYDNVSPNPAVPVFDKVSVAETLPFVNTLRDRNVLSYSRTLDPSSGPPRLDVPPLSPPTGPRIETIWTQGTANNAIALSGDFLQTWVLFPDRTAVTPQNWSVVWEGGLLAGPRFSGQVVPADPTGFQFQLADGGEDFCRLGARAHDVLTLTGCVGDNECGLGKICLHGNVGTQAAGGLAINGLCVDPNQQDSFKIECAGLLSTVRRYEVTRADRQALTVQPRLDELVYPATAPCRMDQPSADGGVPSADGGASTADDCADPLDSTTVDFRCVEWTPGERRCLDRCDAPGSTTGCRQGRICVSFPNGTFCADAPVFSEAAHADPSCFPELTPYQVQAGRSFLVAGTGTPLPPAGAADATGQCTVDPTVISRISMDDIQHCTTVADNTVDSRCNPNLSPGCGQPARDLLAQLRLTPAPHDPCFFVGGPSESDPTTDTSSRHLHALFRNGQIIFMLTNLDRAPTGPLQIQFAVNGGFRPQIVLDPPTVEVSMPARILLGPFDAEPTTGTDAPLSPTEIPYLFVVDQRRLGRSQGGGPTRGQILRIHPLGYPVPGGGLQPIFEDFQRSGNLFPIQ